MERCPFPDELMSNSLRPSIILDGRWTLEIPKVQNVYTDETPAKNVVYGPSGPDTKAHTPSALPTVRTL